MRTALAGATTAVFWLSIALPAHAQLPEPPRAPALSQFRYFHSDHLGSTTLQTDADGNIVTRVQYKPFGEPAASDAVPTFAFTGQRYEESVGLYDYGARFYDPKLGRFLSPDALVPDPYDPQSHNRYSYVRNDPINRIDPTGHDDDEVLDGGGRSDAVPEQDDPEAMGRRLCITAPDGTSVCGGDPGTEPETDGGEERSGPRKGVVSAGVVTDFLNNIGRTLSSPGARGLAEAAFTTFVPFSGAALALAQGHYQGAALEAGGDLVGIGLGAATFGAGYFALKVFKAARAAKRASRAARFLGEAVDLSEAQAKSLAKFNKKLPRDAGPTSVDRLGSDVLFTAEVPGRVPGSRKVFQKSVDSEGETTSFLKTTFDPKGRIPHVKDGLRGDEVIFSDF